MCNQTPWCTPAHAMQRSGSHIRWHVFKVHMCICNICIRTENMSELYCTIESFDIRCSRMHGNAQLEYTYKYGKRTGMRDDSQTRKFSIKLSFGEHPHTNNVAFIRIKRFTCAMHVWGAMNHSIHICA